jgi:hypothetical protein
MGGQSVSVPGHSAEVARVPARPLSATSTETTLVRLGPGRALSVEQDTESARLRVRDEAGAELEIQIRFEASGPSVSVRARSLTLESSHHVLARCETFVVEAREKIELRSQGDVLQQADGNVRFAAHNIDVTAEPGSVRLKANDDVQLLGENVLLNCERPKPMPEWVRQRIRVDLTRIPPEAQAGDPELIELLAD